MLILVQCQNVGALDWLSKDLWFESQSRKFDLTDLLYLLFQIDNYFVAAGLCSSGIIGAGGVGKILAEWLTHGECRKDAWPVDIRRFVGIHNNKKFLRDRVKETLSKYSIVSKLVHSAVINRKEINSDCQITSIDDIDVSDVSQTLCCFRPFTMLEVVKLNAGWWWGDWIGVCQMYFWVICM
jgi:hypothetical protein